LVVHPNFLHNLHQHSITMAPSDEINESTQYCYEDPDSLANIARLELNNGDLLSKIPRRSSMKQMGKPRRATIQFGGEIEVRLPGKSAPIKRKTSIEFNEVPEVEEFKVSEDFFDHIWFNKDEYEEIRSSNKKIIKCIERGTDKNFCVRGLEAQLDNRTHVLRRASIGAVMKEQETQRNAGVFDEEKVSESYTSVCMESKAQAADRAETDNADVQLYLRSAMIALRRMSV
jgi:hypothetical protein